MKRSILIAALCCMAAACGNNESNNDTDMSSMDDMSDMSMEMGEKTAADCSQTQWFEEDKKACQACPSPVLACSSLDAQQMTFNTQTNGVAIILPDSPQTFTKVTVSYTLITRVAAMVEPGQPIQPDEIIKSPGMGTFDVKNRVLSFTVPVENDTHEVRLTGLAFEDACGQQTALDINVVWEPGEAMVSESFTCK